MKKLILVLVCIAIFGCTSDTASFTSEYEQCNDSGFTSCLGVDTVMCDAEFSEAEASCRIKLEKSPLVSNMNEYMKRGSLVGCMLQSVSLSINKQMYEIAQCAK
ncbi:hypothetical protein ONV78_24715 [Hahella sp. CR1]|uniref:hypothetical protein n=1 Tax=Hahella sp. CR1 TaxID=2992807 RepID=UPI0024426318|nr:hypothetical protein [Hahella sp. CR1]MDG9670966.1 hypothetical protein [Hahella sp. CR1]